MFRYRTWQSRPIPNGAGSVNTPILGHTIWTPQEDLNLYGGLWFDSGDPATGLVASWLSHEGLSHNALQAGADTTKPTKGVTGVVFDGGDSVSRVNTTGNIGKHIRSVTLPDGEGSTAGKGITGCGICRIPNTNQFWITNHGQDLPADVTWTPSLVRISYVAGVIVKLQEITLADKIIGIESVQGITYDTSDDTLWFASSTAAGLLKVYHITQAGVLVGDDITPTWAPNGLAYVPADDAIWIGEESSVGNNIEKRSCVDGTVTVAAIATGLTNIDQLFYDVTTKELLLSYGANGAAGNIRVYNAAGASLVQSGTILLPTQTDSVEGIVREGTTLYVLNDGYFHSGASGLNEIMEVQIVPPLSNTVTLWAVVIIPATTGTDCIFEIGTPLGGNGFGLYPTSATGLNVFANTGASGTTQQGSIVATGLSSMAVIPRRVIIHLDVPSDLGTMNMDGAAVQTGSLVNLVGGITNAQTLRIGTASDVRPITGTIKEVGFVNTLMNVTTLDTYLKTKWGL